MPVKFNRLLTLSLVPNKAPLLAVWAVAFGVDKDGAMPVGRFNWSRNCWAAALAEVTLLPPLRIADNVAVVVVGGELFLVVVEPGILVLADDRRLVNDEGVLFLLPSNRVDLPVDPVGRGARFTVFVDTALFKEDRELNRLFRELLFCTAFRLDWLEMDEPESFFRSAEFDRTGKFGRLGVLPPAVHDPLRSDCVLLAKLLDGVAYRAAGVGFVLLSVLVEVMALSEEFIRFTLSVLRPSAAVSAPELLSLPWDGVSETRLCDSSKPSSFSSMLIILFDLPAWRCR